MAELAECRFIMDVWVHLYIAMLQYLVMICDGMLFMHLTKKFWYWKVYHTQTPIIFLGHKIRLYYEERADIFQDTLKYYSVMFGDVL